MKLKIVELKCVVGAFRWILTPYQFSRKKKCVMTDRTGAMEKHHFAFFPQKFPPVLADLFIYIFLYFYLFFILFIYFCAKTYMNLSILGPNNFWPYNGGKMGKRLFFS
jgi:hypothetical protein